MLRTLACLAVAATVVGCGKKRIAPPPEKTIELVGKKAIYRDWSQIRACDVDPKPLSGEVASMNALLNEVLGQTSADENGMWSVEQLALLEDGPMLLPASLTSAEQLQASAKLCPTDPSIDLKVLTELTGQTRRRLELAPSLLTKLKAKAALTQWKEALPGNIASAKKEWCATPKPGVVPDIFFATEDETGKVQWLFCDDSKVTAAPGAAPAFEPAAALKKKPKEKPFLDSAAKYPASDVQRAPKPEAAPAT